MQLAGFVPAMVCLAYVGSTEITRLDAFRFRGLNNLAFNRHIIAKTTVPSVWHCLMICQKQIRCMSFVHAVSTRLCVLHSTVFRSMDEAYSYIGATYHSAGRRDVCPIEAGYLHLRQVNACHHFSNRGRYGFFDGNLRCRKLGGHLSKFNNEQERMAIVNVIKSSRGYGSRWYSGAYKDGPGNTFVWRDGTRAMTRAFWYPGEPGGQGECAFMCSGLKCQFNDHYCNSDKRDILCEIDLQ